MTTTATQHTPGPWTVDGSRIATEFVDTWVCEVNQNVSLDDNYAGEPQANARLIAAAPELLEALQQLVAAANCNYERAAMESEGYFDQARAVIAKATGN